MNSSPEVAASSGSVDIYDAVAASEKHDKKKKRKKQREIKPAGEATAEPEADESRKDKGKQQQEIEASNDSRFVSGEGPAGAEDSRKDEKKKKKQKREVKVSNDNESVIREGPAEPEVEQSRKDKKKKGNIEVSNENESVSGGGPAGAEDSRKDEKKKKKREVKVSNDIESVIREGPAEPEVEQSRKDKKKKGDIEVSNENESVSGGGLAKPAGEGSGKDGKKRKRESSGEQDTKGKETAKEDKKSRKRKKKDAAEGAEEDKVDEVGSSVGKDTEPKKRAVKPRPKEPRKKVSFSGKVEVFPPTNDDSEDGTVEPLVQGKRYTPEEDKLVKEAVFKYIEVNQLGEEGLQMVLSSSKHPQVRNCWKEIGASLSWRPWESVYYRAHVLFERSEKRKWEPEEYEALRSFYNKHGADWKTLAKILGKHRFHVKDTWRRIGMPNKKKGNWSQEEYQGLFDLVNLDLKMKAFEERKTKHGMLRDNISWGAISEKLSTRFSAACCTKWYDQLSSHLVNEGLWVDSDDYRLVDALQKLDACCAADVDWDNLLKHRSGEICRKRWDQMVRHIGGNLEKSFVEQVDVLSKRYRSEMIEYRKE